MSTLSKVILPPFIHTLKSKDGKYIVLPIPVRGQPKLTHLALPNPHANSSVGDTQQSYPLGTTFVDGKRVFQYGYVYDDLKRIAILAGAMFAILIALAFVVG